MTAEELFDQGYNCGQSVFLSHAEELGISSEWAQRLSAPLGAGLGGLRRTCGALTALCLLAGLRYGGYDPNDLEAKTQFYALIQRLDEEFSTKFGTSQCSVLLANAGCSVVSTPSARTAEYYAARPCARCIRFADELFERHIRHTQADYPTLSFDPQGEGECQQEQQAGRGANDRIGGPIDEE